MFPGDAETAGFRETAAANISTIRKGDKTRGGGEGEGGGHTTESCTHLVNCRVVSQKES